jgi:CRP-like cAMP-binding protein/tetratricopeptide (TPR) repeat protein
MAAPSVNSRKLKDSVAEYLQKNKLDKACETLELLVKAEPKDMPHRLKLGDTYRRLGETEKAIGSYEIAAKFFADEGLLIKAIAAIKIILEIDPKNQMAQRELGEMNRQRFGRPPADFAGAKLGKPAAPPAPAPLAAPRTAPLAPRTAPLDVDAGATALANRSSAFGGELELPAAGDDEPLDLDDGRPFRPAAENVASRPRGQPPRKRGAFELGAAVADPIEPEALEEAELVDDEDEHADPEAELVDDEDEHADPEAELVDEEEELEELPSEAIVEVPRQKTSPSKPSMPKPRAPVSAPPRAAPPARPPPPPREAIDDEDEPLDLGRRTPSIRADPPARPARSVAATGSSRPIADLLVSDTDEVELLSISSDRDLPPQMVRAYDAPPLNATVPLSLPPPPKVPLFDDLPQAAFVDLVNRLTYLQFRPPELIIREGDPGRSFFVIVEGKVRIFKEQKGSSEITLAYLSEGAFFGEMALLSGAPRTANVAAEEDTGLLEVTDAVLREVVEKYPQVAKSLKKFYRQRLLNNVMAISPLFKDFDMAERKSIVDRFKMRQFAQGEVLITEGTPSEGLFVVLHGAVNVEARDANNQRVALARLKEGEVFGEISLLTRKNATATVTALSNSIVLKLPRENFQELVVTHPQILELVSALSEKRLSATQAILQGQGPGVDGMAFV